VGLTLPLLKAETAIGLLKGEDKHHIRQATMWPSKDSSLRGLVYTTQAMQAEYATTLTDVHKIEKTAERGKKKDVEFIEVPTTDVTLDQSSYSLYCVMDGHNGHEASQFCMSVLQREVHKRLPEGLWPLETAPSATVWLARVRAAVVMALAATERKFSASGISSGATCTLILQTGWALTVANVGDSTAYVDTGAEVFKLSEDHRFDCKKDGPERARLKQFEPRYVVRQLKMTMDGVAGENEEGIGPYRLWPGGLAVTRSIGDFDVGEPVTCSPHVMQVRIPETGCRLVVASDGLWDVDKGNDVQKIVKVRKLNTKVAATKLRRKTGKNYGLQDDVTIAVVDILPGSGVAAVPGLFGTAEAGSVSGISKVFRCFVPGKKAADDPSTRPPRKTPSAGVFAGRTPKKGDRHVEGDLDAPPTLVTDQNATNRGSPASETGRGVVLTNGLVIPEDVDPGNMAYMFNDKDGDQSVSETSESAIGGSGKAGLEQVPRVRVLARVDYAKGAAAHAPELECDRRLRDFLQQFEANSRKCWWLSNQLKRKNMDPCDDAEIISLCSNLQDVCSLGAVGL